MEIITWLCILQALKVGSRVLVSVFSRSKEAGVDVPYLYKERDLTQPVDGVISIHHEICARVVRDLSYYEL